MNVHRAKVLLLLATALIKIEKLTQAIALKMVPFLILRSHNKWSK